MVDNILNEIKQLLGLEESYDAFNLDIIIHINSALAIVNQLGLGPDDALVVDSETTWDSLELPAKQLSMVKSYIFLKTRMSFDPPTSGFLIDSMNKVIQEQEQRLSYSRETSSTTLTS